jgi:RNA polymerase sigma-70 factor (ECF subfamily)
LVRAVHTAIAGLDRPAREVIVLRDLEGLSAEETCGALGVELAAMKSRLHRARRALREALNARDTARTFRHRS